MHVGKRHFGKKHQPRAVSCADMLSGCSNHSFFVQTAVGNRTCFFLFANGVSLTGFFRWSTAVTGKVPARRALPVFFFCYYSASALIFSFFIFFISSLFFIFRCFFQSFFHCFQFFIFQFFFIFLRFSIVSFKVFHFCLTPHPRASLTFSAAQTGRQCC